MDDKKVYTFKFSDDLRRRAKAAAIVENRSLASLIVDAIAHRVAAVEQREAVRELAKARRSAV